MDTNRDHHRDAPSGTGRRSFLKGATTTLVAAGAVGTSVTNAFAANEGSHTTSTRRIESWDGTELATRLYLPADEGPAPAVLITHGYGGDKEGGIPGRMGATYADNGYVVLTYDSRGFGESGGEVGVDGPKEVRDARHLLDWLQNATQETVGRDGSAPLVARDGKDGIKVGMDGLSYAGGIQLNVAAVDDRLDAIVPRWAWNDLTYSLAPNGGIKAGWATILQEFGFAGSRGLQSGDDQPNQRDLERGVDPRLYKFYTQSAATNEFSPEANAFFKLRSPSTKARGLAENAPPALLVTGWNDTLFNAVETVRNHELLEAGGQDCRMVFIRGGHSLEQQAPLQQATIDEMVLAWMDEHVAGGANAKLPEVTYWHGQDAEFKAAPRGLPSAADGAARTLASASNASSGTTTLAGGPVGASNSQILVQRNDDYAPGTYADFDYVASEETQVLGVPELTLTATPLGQEPLVFAKLYHVAADGSEELIYNQATPYELEGPVGEPQESTFALAGVERRIAPGETLRLALSTTDAMFFNSRTSAGVQIDHDATELRLPIQRGRGLDDAA